MLKKSFTILLLLLPITLYASQNANGSISKQSKHNVTNTADRIEELINEKGLTLFARVDHSANAESVNMTLRPTELIIFGNPKLGTPLMKCKQTVGLDLPQKFLVWEDRKGKVWVTYNKPSYIKRRHSVKECDEVLKTITKALAGLASTATN